MKKMNPMNLNCVFRAYAFDPKGEKSEERDCVGEFKTLGEAVSAMFAAERPTGYVVVLDDKGNWQIVASHKGSDFAVMNQWETEAKLTFNQWSKYL